MNLPSVIKLARYVPAVLCGLLAVAWLGSVFVTFNWRFRWPSGSGRETASIGCSFGSVVTTYFPDDEEPPRFTAARHTRSEIAQQGWLGRLTSMGYINVISLCPLPFLLTFLLPLAIGPFNRFRFPLWTWFAWTTLVAVEFAYYLYYLR